MSWLRGQNATIGTPIPLNGPGRIRRCVPGSINMPCEFSAGFRAVDTSEGEGRAGLGCLCRQGKIQKHAKFAAACPSLMNAATAVASQVMLVSIAMQLNRIEGMIQGLSARCTAIRLRRYSLAWISSRRPCSLRDLANRRYAIMNAVQTLHEGLRKTIPEISPTTWHRPRARGGHPCQPCKIHAAVPGQQGR